MQYRLEFYPEDQPTEAIMIMVSTAPFPEVEDGYSVTILNQRTRVEERWVVQSRELILRPASCTTQLFGTQEPGGVPAVRFSRRRTARSS